MAWRDDFADQNLRMAQKMLEQQGEVNAAKAEVEKAWAEVREQRQMRSEALAEEANPGEHAPAD